MDNEVKLEFQNTIVGLNDIKEYEQRLTNIKNIISTFPKNINLGNSNYEKQVNNINKSLNITKNNLDDISKITKLAFNYTTLRTFARALKNVIQTMSSYIAKSSSYLEDINLFQVAFDNTYNSAEKFINKLTEMYGLDEKWLTRTVAIFKQLSNAMNLSVEQGTKLSKLMTQMSIDISSLYNLDVDRASSVLQSALAGQTKPIDFSGFTLKKVLKKIVNTSKSGVRVIINKLFKQEMVYQYSC